MGYADGDSLKVRIRVAFGARIGADPSSWAWTDVTAWWHTPDSVDISWGRSDGAEQPETSTMTLTLKNTDGRFTATYPASPYWPHVQTWTPITYDIDLGDGRGWLNRFSGYVRRWPVAWPGGSRHQALARIEAVGVLGRLARGKPPARSSMRRTIAASGVLAYWPAEDGAVSTQVASAVPGVPPMSLSGPVSFVPLDKINVSGDTSGFSRYGTLAMLDLASGGSLAGTVPAHVTTATARAWTVHAFARVSLQAGGSTVVLMEWETPASTYVRWQLRWVGSSYRYQLVAYDADGGTRIVVDEAGVPTSSNIYDISAWQDGGTIRVGHRWLGSSYLYTGSLPGTLAGITALRVNATGATIPGDQMPVGHIAIWAAAPYSYQYNATRDPYDGIVRGPLARPYEGETAHLRLVRLAAEDGLPVAVAPVADAGSVTRMGDQPAATLLELLGECERTDQGLIYEEGWGLGYLPRAARYSPPVALTIDAARRQLGMPFEPVLDDQRLRNVWMVERAGGSSAVAADQESIDAQGEIEASVTVNLVDDAPLGDHAGWRLHQSTVRDVRYPALSIDLGASPELAAAWVGCRPGSRVQVLHPPPQAPPGTVDQLIVGASETYQGRRSWTVTMAVEPASPWLVPVVDGDGRAAADESWLADPVGETETGLLVASSLETGPWTSDPADLPVDVMVGGGELVRATSVTPSLHDRFDRLVADSWGSGWENLGGVAGDHFVDARGAVHRLSHPNENRRAVIGPPLVDSDIMVTVTIPMVAVTDSIDVGLVSRFVNSSNFYVAVLHCHSWGTCEMRIRKRVAGVYTTMAIATAGFHYGAGSRFHVRMATFGPFIGVRTWPAGAREPLAWHASVVDLSLTAAGRVGTRSNLQVNWGGPLPVDIVYRDFRVLNPQRMTVQRGINGVRRAWPAGTAVDVHQPGIVAL